MVGSLADWSTTFVALLAFIVAAIAARATIQTNRAQQQTLELQRKQFEQAQLKSRREQAEKVAFWPHPERQAVCILNASNLPIYHVDIQFPIVEDGGGTYVHTLPPTGDEPRIFDFTPVPGYEDHIYDEEVFMYFYDAAGVAWKRNEDGDLIEDPPGRSVAESTPSIRHSRPHSHRPAS